MQPMHAAVSWLITELESGRGFLTFSSELRYLEQMGEIDRGKLQDSAEEYAFSEPVAFDVPKGGGAYRSGSHISLHDRLIVLSALLKNHSRILRALGPTQYGKPDYNRAYPETLEQAGWFTEYREDYKAFRERSEQAVAQGKYVVSTDIVGMSDNIDHGRLDATLSAIGVSSADRQQIRRALFAWSGGDMKGIPQGTVITDILNKIAMLPIDRDMAEQHYNIEYYRYNDDIRLVADNEEQALEHFAKLKAILNSSGFEVSDHKTKIIGPDTPTSEGFSLTPFLEPVWDEIKSTLEEQKNVPLNELDYDDLPEEFLGALYSTYVDSDEDCPKPLRNFILNRMSKKKMTAYLSNLAKHLDEFPEIIPNTLRGVEKYSANQWAKQCVLVAASHVFSEREGVDPSLGRYQRLAFMSWISSVRGKQFMLAETRNVIVGSVDRSDPLQVMSVKDIEKWVQRRSRGPSFLSAPRALR